MRRLAFLLLLLVASSLAVAPPHPDAEKEVHELHRRMMGRYTSNGSISNSTSTRSMMPQLVNPRLCQDLTDEECAAWDHRSLMSARQLKAISQKTGYLRVLVICVVFTNHIDKWVPGTMYLEELFNSPVAIPNAPGGSVKMFVEQNAQGNLEVDFDIMPWLVTDESEAHYSFNISGLTGRFAQCAHPVLDQLEEMGIDWTLYDQDGDGQMDASLLLHSGYQAELGATDCLGQKKENRIWSHAIHNNARPWTSARTGITWDNYAVGNGNRGRCGNRMSFVGIMTHEFLHLFGLADLNDNSGNFIGWGLGHFSIMANPYGVDNRDTHPTHLTPWEKIYLGWVEPVEIDSDGTYELYASANSTELYIIQSPFPKYEYFLIENRQPIGFDQQMWNGGIVLWHIDDTKLRMRERGYPGQPGWPGNNNHYQLANLQADGRYDIEVGGDQGNMGDDGDFWRDGMQIGPWVVEEEATVDGIYPNTNSYKFGEIKQTGLRIYDFSPSGTVMSFTVEGLGQGESVPPTPPPPTSPPPSAGPTPPPSPPPSVAPIAPSNAPVSPTLPPSPGPTPQPLPSYFPSNSMAPSIAPSNEPSNSLKPSSLSSESSMEPSMLPPADDVLPSASSRPSSLPSDIPSMPTMITTVSPIVMPSSPPLAVPDVPVAAVPWCRGYGEPCQDYLHCCSKRCYYGDESTPSYCLNAPDPSKNALKLGGGRGGAGAE